MFTTSFCWKQMERGVIAGLKEWSEYFFQLGSWLRRGYPPPALYWRKKAWVCTGNVEHSVCVWRGESRLLESVLCFNRRARLTDCEGGLGVTRNAVEDRSKKIAFYGHPSSSHVSIGGNCLTLLPLSSHPRAYPASSLKPNRWTWLGWVG